MSDYAEYTRQQIQHISKERHLRAVGTKYELVARLIDYDNNHSSPSPFLGLPGEIRNKIYQYVATFQKPRNASAIKSAIDRRELPLHVCAGDLQNQASIALPGFFHTCSQIYQESRPFFYRHREFKLHIWQDPEMKRESRCLKKVLAWFDTIGVKMQKQIQTLEIDLKCDRQTDLYAYIWFVDTLHAKLSDKATVIYRPISRMRARHDVSFLWGIGRNLHVRDPRRVPQYEHPNWSLRGSLSPGTGASTMGTLGYARNPLDYTPKKNNVDRPSLTFGPGEGWFGHETETEST